MAEERHQENFIKKHWVIIALVLGVIAIAVLLYFLFRKKPEKQTETPPTITARDIQNVFNPPSGQAPTFPAATSSPPFLAPSSTPPIRSAPVQPEPPRPALQFYKNTDLGFETQITSDWQANAVGGQVVDFASAQGQHVTVEVYSGVSDTLETIEKQLALSDSVKETRRENFKNIPAVKFTTLAGEQGVALVYNGRVYYIRGALGSSVAESMKFI